MKKTSFVLVLMLLLSLSAQAAPTRSLTPAALEHAELIAQIQPLADAVAAVAMRQGIDHFQDGTPPDSSLMEGLLYQALSSHLVVAEASDTVVRLSCQEALAVARRLFFIHDLPEFENPVYPGVSLEEGMLRFDTARQDDFIGAYIHDIAITEEEMILKADIFRLNGIVAGAVDAPEESLTWLGYLDLQLRPQADALLDFSLSGFTVIERYTPTGFALYIQKNRFEVQYPDFLSRELEQEDSFLSLSSEDGTVTLEVRDVPGTLETLETDWLQQNNANEHLYSASLQNNRLLLFAPGIIRLAYFDPQNGMDTCLVLEMRFPPEKEQEFSLWKTFLENSFVVYSHSVG